MFRTGGGFIVNYFQVERAVKSGAINSFGTEAGIVAAVFVIVAVQIFGASSRSRFPSPAKYEDYRHVLMSGMSREAIDILGAYQGRLPSESLPRICQEDCCMKWNEKMKLCKMLRKP